MKVGNIEQKIDEYTYGMLAGFHPTKYAHRDCMSMTWRYVVIWQSTSDAKMGMAHRRSPGSHTPSMGLSEHTRGFKQSHIECTSWVTNKNDQENASR